MKCPKCGNHNFDAKGRCTFCGHSVAVAPRPPAGGALDFYGSPRTEDGAMGAPPPNVGRSEGEPEPPDLTECPLCRQKSLHWNERFGYFECLNEACRRSLGIKDDETGATTQGGMVPVADTDALYGGQLQQCPRCGQRSLWWNRFFVFYECTNRQCGKTYSKEEIEARASHSSVRPACPFCGSTDTYEVTGMRRCRTCAKLFSTGGQLPQRQAAKSAPTAPPRGIGAKPLVQPGPSPSAKAWFGNEYYDAAQRRWRKPKAATFHPRKRLMVAAAVLLAFVLVGCIAAGVAIYVLTLPPHFGPPPTFGAAAGILQTSLTWSNNSEAEQVMIRCHTSGYPATPADGDLVYQGLGTNYTHKDLHYGDTYYYCAWSVRTVNGLPKYSASAASASSTPTWTGPNGETVHEYVDFEEARIVGADGEYIELLNNPEAGDPTWAELRQFLQNDQTEKTAYSDNTFVCADFAEMLHNNAEKAGLRTAYVIIDFGPVGICTPADFFTGCPGYCGGLHSCNAFQTTDRGLVYVDDTGMDDGSGEDCTVSLASGQTYIPVSIFSDTEWCPVGRVSDFQVTW